MKTSSRLQVESFGRNNSLGEQQVSSNHRIASTVWRTVWQAAAAFLLLSLSLGSVAGANDSSFSGQSRPTEGIGGTATLDSGNQALTIHRVENGVATQGQDQDQGQEQGEKQDQGQTQGQTQDEGQAETLEQEEEKSPGSDPAAPQQEKSAPAESAPKSDSSDPKTEQSEDDGEKQDEGEKQDDDSQQDEGAEDSRDSADESDDEDSDRAERRRRSARFMQFTKFNEHMRELLRGPVESISKSTIEVYVDDATKPSALGMIVDAQGFAMTKASMLKGAVRCKLANGRMVPAIVFGVDTDTDLALLRLQATNLSPVPWSLQPEQEALEGHWVLTPGLDGTLRSLGVVSVMGRKIPSASGFIGIQMQPHADGVEVTQVIKGTAADRFGLKTSDVIVAVDEEPVTEPADLSGVLRGKRPGDVVSLSIKRGSTAMALRVVLGNREEDNPDNQRAINQNTMSGEISKRRDDFPFALQHDSVLTPEECGGPLVDLDGRVVGLNIARSGRVNSYALPSSLVQSVFERLATGQYSPEVVFAERLKGYETVLLNLNVEEVKLTAEKSELELEFEKKVESAEATQKEISEIEKQIEALKQQIKGKESDLESSKTQQAQIESKIRGKEREIENSREQKEKIEKEKKELLFGAS